MSLHLLLAGWLSAHLVAQAPVDPNRLDPAVIKAVKASAPQLSWTPGVYPPDALKAPTPVAMETLDAQWNTGPNWPATTSPVVVVTPAKHPDRFFAFLVDIKTLRVVAIRHGDRVRHFSEISGLSIGADRSDGGPIGRVDRGTGAVIIVRPPNPPGPGGIPTDLVASVLDTASFAHAAQQMIAGQPLAAGPR